MFSSSGGDDETNSIETTAGGNKFSLLPWCFLSLLLVVIWIGYRIKLWQDGGVFTLFGSLPRMINSKLRIDLKKGPL